LQRSHFHAPYFDREAEQTAEFFKDLGELRGKMWLLVRMLLELEPKAKASTLLGAN
jgi:hypothetical protein